MIPDESEPDGPVPVPSASSDANEDGYEPVYTVVGVSAFLALLAAIVFGVTGLCTAAAVSFVIFFGLLVFVGAATALPSVATQERELQERKMQDARIVCPQCQTRGHVTTKKVQAKKGIHGGKATAALLTGGISMLGTGLSRHEELTEATCSYCGSTWRF
jgi:hypothetical protein